MVKATMKVLSRDQIELIHLSSLNILSDVGVKIDSPAVVHLLEEAGAKTDRKESKVFLHEELISQSLRSAPKKVKICSRRGVDYTIPNEEVQLVSPDGQPPAVFEVATGKRRPSTLKDVIDFAILSDALDEVDFIWPSVVATDVPPSKSSFYEFLATIAYSSKHVQHGARSTEEANFQVEVATAIAGSPEEFRKRPIFSDVCTPISPLRYDRGEAEALVTLSRAGVPMVHLSMGIAGSATPVTLAGTLAVVNAENLCGLTISQVASPGAPSIYSSFSGITDLKSGIFLCGTSEGILLDAAAVEMARHYGLPSCAGGPSNAARSLSAEAGYQTAMTALASMLTGSDLMVGLGGLDRAGMMSPEKFVMDCEVWRWLKRVRAGISVDESTIGFDAIKRAGPGGIYLSDPHTLKFMRKELLIPQATTYHVTGEPNYSVDELIEYSKRKTREILATHKPPLLPQEVSDKIRQVSEKYGISLKAQDQIFGWPNSFAVHGPL
jgi:trimethylamine--corrinoid protein Co-methyltransferase